MYPFFFLIGKGEKADGYGYQYFFCMRQMKRLISFSKTKESRHEMGVPSMWSIKRILPSSKR